MPLDKAQLRREREREEAVQECLPSEPNPYCTECEGSGILICGWCAGSGEGPYDGTTCLHCKGTGAANCECTER